MVVEVSLDQVNVIDVNKFVVVRWGMSNNVEDIDVWLIFRRMLQRTTAGNGAGSYNPLATALFLFWLVVSATCAGLSFFFCFGSVFSMALLSVLSIVTLWGSQSSRRFFVRSRSYAVGSASLSTDRLVLACRYQLYASDHTDTLCWFSERSMATANIAMWSSGTEQSTSLHLQYDSYVLEEEEGGQRTCWRK